MTLFISRNAVPIELTPSLRQVGNRTRLSAFLCTEMRPDIEAGYVGIPYV